jgi:hypothetical protein
MPVSASISSSGAFCEPPSAADAFSSLPAKTSLEFFRLSIRDLHNEIALEQYGMASSVLHASS